MAHLRIRLAAGLLLVAGSCFAQQTPIRLSVDASDAVQRLLHAHMTIPVKPGPMSLLYPKWIPGEHGPTGPIEDVAGVRITANGKTIPWRRDDVEVYEFHVDIPQGVSQIDVALDFISPPESGGFSSGGSITAQLAVLSWNQLLLYPKGPPADQLTYQADLKLPQGWKFGTALPIDRESGNEVVFKPAPLNTLIDSPVQTGANYRTVDLNPGGLVAGGTPHYLHIAADSDRATRITDEQTKAYRNLVEEANTLFGAHHYRDYQFLYTLSDHVAHFGLEHHESSDDRTDELALVDEDERILASSLLSHEFVHSWNGKYRRPAGLVIPDYSQPMKGELLWVYEGLTEYLGEILAPRSGLLSSELFLDSLASEAAALDKEYGRTWRPLEDTAVDAQILYNARKDYEDFRRSTDFYEEGTLIWLNVDVLIRTLSNGRKSIDDFCKAWAGPPSTGPEVKPYNFDDVVNTLNSVQPYDWASFLHTRLQSTAPNAPLEGITNGGYNLTYSSERSGWTKTWENVHREVMLAYSIGAVMRETGEVVDVHVNSPAFQAGLAPSMTIVAVNGRVFSPAVVRHAIADAVANTAPIALLVRDGEYYKTLNVNYHGGEKYPHLTRDQSKKDLISDIIRPHATGAAAAAVPPR